MKKLAFFICIIIITSCKKDKSEPSNNNQNNQNGNCTYTTNVVAIDGTVKNILGDSCRVFGSNYYTEHFVDASRTEGVSIIFNGTAAPVAGNYSVANTFSAIDATHVYVEYYTAADAFQPSTGTVTVADNGGTKIYTFCNLSSTNGAVVKSISLRAVCN